MPNYLMHRICFNSEISYPFLENGWLSIGYIDANIFAKSHGLDLISLAKECQDECGGIPESCPHQTEAGKQVYDILEQTYSWKQGTLIPRTRCLVSFLSLEPSDIVLMPHSDDAISSWGSGFSLFEVEGTPVSTISPSKELVESTASICTFGENKVSSLHSPTGDGKYEDVGFVIKARLLCPKNRDIDRDYASPKLRNIMRIPQTNKFCNDFKKEIDELIKTHK